MSNFHQFDPGQVKLTLGVSPTPITGFAKGTFIEVERDEDAFKKFVGSDGEVTRVRNRNTAGMVKITLDQGSQSNAYLSGLADLDEASGSGVVPMSLVDYSGVSPVSAVSSPQAWCRKRPKMDFAGEADSPRVWIFDMASCIFEVGGN